nr:hypothetical protein [uncultured Actinoplanes sp.]
MDDIKVSDTMAPGDVRVDAAEVKRLVGSPMTAYLANLESVVDLNGRLEKDDDEGLRPRLRLVLDLANLFRKVNAISRFRAWLREVDTGLGPTSPAALIRDSADAQVGDRLTRAATRYLRTV